MFLRIWCLWSLPFWNSSPLISATPVFFGSSYLILLSLFVQWPDLFYKDIFSWICSNTSNWPWLKPNCFSFPTSTPFPHLKPTVSLFFPFSLMISHQSSFPGLRIIFNSPLLFSDSKPYQVQAWEASQIYSLPSYSYYIRSSYILV